MRYVALSIGGSYVRCVPGIVILVPQVRADGTGLGDESIFERIEVGPSQVVLHSLIGGYLQALPGDTLAINPDGYEVWETFQEIEWPDDRFSLKTWRGKFVCAEGGGGREVVANRTTAGEWEKFYYEVPPAGLLPVEPPQAPPKQRDRLDPRRKLPGQPDDRIKPDERRRFP